MVGNLLLIIFPSSKATFARPLCCSMAAHHVALSVLILAVALLAPSGHVAGEPWPVCGDSGEYDDKSEYQANLNLVAAALPKNASASPNLFATAEAGAVPEKVTALALCRGDATSRACSTCLANAFANLPNVCPGSKDAVIYYDACMLRYSAVQFLSADDSGPMGLDLSMTVRNSGNATSEPALYQRVVATLMNATADYAAFNSSRRYATGQADLDREFPKVYSWAQCTPDLTPGRCRDCLAQILAQLPLQFTDGIGGRLLAPRCSFRYETKPFMNGPVIVQLRTTSPSSGAAAPAIVPTAPASATAQGRKYSVPGMVLIILLPTMAAINLVAWLFTWRRRRQALTKAKQPDQNDSIGEAEDIESVESMLIDISTLRAATEDFAENNKLGEGGFGPVFKGTLLNGDEIAVKRLSKSSTQGVEELKNELALVAKLKHKNLVRLVGVCLEQQERLLIYEFVPNRSLDLVLFDEEKRQQLDWETRFKIINGVARGMQYLHEDSQLKVVHRDLKASNVLLDMNMNPKISDFGLAKIFGREQTHGVTNRVVGTRGYMAPEYVMRGNYSVKSDVFSFGVLVLEIVTGKKNSDCHNFQQSPDLLTTVWEHWTAGTMLEMIDPCMNKSFSESDALRCIHVGLLCIQGSPEDRPMMSTVAMMLGNDAFSLPAPSKPTFYSPNGGANSSTGSSMSIPSVQARS